MSPNETGWPGHAVLQVPAPALEGPVRARYQHYDDTLLSPDPEHVHAHVTVLGPVPARFTRAQEQQVANLCRATAPFAVTLNLVRAFPDGIIYVPPADPEPWNALTQAMHRVFPDHPPYAGAHPAVPHVTVDLVGPNVTLDTVRRELAPLLPAQFTADRLELAWYRPFEVRALRTWHFGRR